MILCVDFIENDWVVFEAAIRHLEGTCEEEQEVGEHFLIEVVKSEPEPLNYLIIVCKAVTFCVLPHFRNYVK